MPANLIRDIVNLLIYGGAFIGLCAACLTALSFELLGGIDDHLPYITLIAVSTACLYAVHRVIGLHKLSDAATSERYVVIRKYKIHIWLYSIGWAVLTIWWLRPLFSIAFLLWMLPGGVIALGYIMPLFSKGRRLRDFGWFKIVLIGWSWGWLTGFMPAYYFMGTSLYLSVLIGINVMMFIIVLTIPFDIRDIAIDTSVGLKTMPSRFGLTASVRTGYLFCFLVVVLSAFLGIHFINPGYFFAMTITILASIWLLKKSAYIDDDYFFSGLTDGMMIIALVIFWVFDTYIL